MQQFIRTQKIDNVNIETALMKATHLKSAFMFMCDKNTLHVAFYMTLNQLRHRLCHLAFLSLKIATRYFSPLYLKPIIAKYIVKALA